MKKLLFLLSGVLLFSFTPADEGVSKKEKKYAVKFLKESQKDLMKTVKGLSPKQLSFKATPESWSIDECMKHIAISEKNLRGMLDGTLHAAADPEKRKEVKVTDEGIIKMIEDRDKKVKTQEAFEPKNTPYNSMMEASNSFKEYRGNLIMYAKTSNDDLRNHIATLPFGPIDAYQVMLFIGAHTNRHRHQIEEIMADPDFPKM